MSTPRYAVGIDLGTTHCALSWVDSEKSEGESLEQRQLAIPQLITPGAVEGLALLPSALYLPHPEEFNPDDLALPWPSEPGRITGTLARNQGTTTPIRLVASAKSWLCHPDVDRKAPILPAAAPDEVAKISPYAATVQLLTHLRNAWNGAHPYNPLERQEVTVTVPASFDPAARELTAEAARAIGLERLVLLEEPQAALYSWVNDSAGSWRAEVTVGDIILVVDVGGGTTDLSLIAVTENAGTLELNRIAVGEHILLGGDNMDLALAALLRKKLADTGVELDRWQFQALTHGCRQAKETLLADPQLDHIPVVVPSRSARLIGGSIRTELTRDEVHASLLEGFFPLVAADARPQSRARGALTRVGLPYAQDPAITRHLAAFLGRQVNATRELEGFENDGTTVGFIRPTAVLFNGGVFKAAALRERVMQAINQWLADAGAAPARPLEAHDLDLAVARGAAFHAHVRHHGGVRIRGGTSHSYYVGVESAMPAIPGMEPELNALCLVPFGLEEGSEPVEPPQEFGLVVGEPVRFRFFGSTVRREDQVGELLEDWLPEALEELDEIQTTLPPGHRRQGDIVAVRLRAGVSEVGTLELSAIPLDGGDEQWDVAFNTRGTHTRLN